MQAPQIISIRRPTGLLSRELLLRWIGRTVEISYRNRATGRANLATEPCSGLLGHMAVAVAVTHVILHTYIWYSKFQGHLPEPTIEC